MIQKFPGFFTTSTSNYNGSHNRKQLVQANTLITAKPTVSKHGIKLKPMTPTLKNHPWPHPFLIYQQTPKARYTMPRVLMLYQLRTANDNNECQTWQRQSPARSK